MLHMQRGLLPVDSDQHNEAWTNRQIRSRHVSRQRTTYEDPAVANIDMFPISISSSLSIAMSKKEPRNGLHILSSIAVFHQCISLLVTPKRPRAFKMKEA